MSGSADRPTWKDDAEVFDGWNGFWATVREGNLHSTLQIADFSGSGPLEAERVFRGRVVAVLRDWLDGNPQEPESEAFRVIVATAPWQSNSRRIGLMRDRRRTAASGSPRSPIAHGGMTNGMSGSPAAVMVVDPPGHAPSRRAGKLQNQPSVEVPHLTERVGHQRLIGHVLSPGRIGGGLGPPRWRGTRDRAEQAALGDGGP